MSALEAIRRVIALYSQLIDDKRLDEWGELFTDDARFVARGTVAEGRASIVETVGQMTATVHTKHLVASPVIDLVADDEAVAWTDLTTFVAGADGASIATLGRYHDRLQRGADGRWRFRVRVLVLAGEPVPDHMVPPPAS